MRTTLDIDDEVLVALKEKARRENTTVSKFVSRYMRLVLTGELMEREKTDLCAEEVSKITGFQPFPSRGKIVTDDINRLRDKQGIVFYT